MAGMFQLVQVGRHFLRHGKVVHIAPLHQMNQRRDLRSNDGDVVVFIVVAFCREVVNGNVQMLRGEVL